MSDINDLKIQEDILRKYHQLLNLKGELTAEEYLYQHYKNHNTHKKTIKVGFLVQLAALWDNQVNVYEEMKHRDGIEPIILVVPQLDLKTGKPIDDYETNYFVKTYPDAIYTYSDNKFIDLEQFGLDYIFYTRPYDHYLPEQYASGNVLRYVKTCFIPYAYSGAINFLDLETDPLFFRNMYLMFMESIDMCAFMRANRKSFYELGLQKVFYLGFPAFEPYLEKTFSKKEIHTILWTPRWSYDPKYGGSNFLEYKDLPFVLKREYSDVEIIFRPHPLLFGELKDKGLMDENTQLEYLDTIDKYGITYDKDTPFQEALKKADLMVTDFSSIVFHWFLTGKPCVYCVNPVIELYGVYEEISKRLYIAENESDIYDHVSSLIKDSNDYKRSERLEFIDSIVDEHLGASKRIVDTIVEDFYGV